LAVRGHGTPASTTGRRTPMTLSSHQPPAASVLPGGPRRQQPHRDRSRRSRGRAQQPPSQDARLEDIVKASERFDRSSRALLRDAQQRARRACWASRTEHSAITGAASPLRGSHTHTIRSVNRQRTIAYSCSEPQGGVATTRLSLAQQLRDRGADLHQREHGRVPSEQGVPQLDVKFRTQLARRLP
jgi:hypothetical protein